MEKDAKISKEEIRHLAELCRLGLSEEEGESFRKELSSVLDYAGQLGKIDISGADADSRTGNLKNVTREDEIEERNKEEAERLLEAAPEREGDYVKTKAVL